MSDINNNPWKSIELIDYENHMNNDSVGQLSALNSIMQSQFSDYDVTSCMILGVAGGNGLEHVDIKKYNKIYGVDVNENYLKVATDRFPSLNRIFTPLCQDLCSANILLPTADLLIADIILEYIGYEAFARAVIRVKPIFVSIVIVDNSGVRFVSESPYSGVFKCLDGQTFTVDKQGIETTMTSLKYSFVKSEKTHLPNGKTLIRLDYKIN